MQSVSPEIQKYTRPERPHAAPRRLLQEGVGRQEVRQEGVDGTAAADGQHRGARLNRGEDY